MVLVLVVVFFSASFVYAEQSALSGLGEPAAPESMAHPERIEPQPSVWEHGPLPSSAELYRPTPIKDLSREARKQPTLLKPLIEKTVEIHRPFTLSGAVSYAEHNYPVILKGMAQVQAAKENIKVQKLNEYMPDGLFQFQEVMASHNKLSQIIYGSPVFPANPGPGFGSVGMSPLFFSGQGFNLDWAPLDFGLHKARIQLAKEQYRQTEKQFVASQLDVEIAAASAFLDVVQASAQVEATEENVRSFDQFKTVVDAQVKADLKPGADAALALAQLANSQNQLLQARLNYDVARADLANALGLAGIDIDIMQRGLVSAYEEAQIQRSTPIFEDVPILQATKETILTALAQRQVLSKEYAPVFHFLGGVQTRGSNLNNAGKITYTNLAGLLPATPNYQVALIVNWNFLDCFRLKAEKRVQDQRIIAQQQEYNLVLQNLKTEDARSRVRVRTALAVAANMPAQVAAAEIAVSQAEARYSNGLSGVAQVAEANQVLAQSRMQAAVAKVAVWRAMLAVASAHGDLNPFLAEADRIQRGM